MHIIGTAGHVDHGKSALVRALTGTEPDRWAEEQRRGMTLDLGFAHLTFDDGVEAGIVDVPGHERFLHNMLAGAAGMELVLLVVAANEGVKPQTLEHLAILRYLNVRSTLLVLSKSDTVDGAERADVQTRIHEALLDTIAQDAPVYPVSIVTGDGLGALREAIHAALTALPSRTPHAPAYLPIDRVFALAGHGTIVTGTLMQGRIAIGDTLALEPLSRSVRVRNLHVFGSKRQAVSGGTRVAINVPGIDTAEIARGAVLAAPTFKPSARFRVQFQPLPTVLALVKRRTPVRAYIGAAEILATLVLDELPTRGERVAGALHLRIPTVAVPGAPFIVRRVSPMNLLGGGTIAANGANDATTTLADDGEATAVLATLAKSDIAGSTAAQIGALANINEDRVLAKLAALVADGHVLLLVKPPGYVTSAAATQLFERAVERLRERQAERPWRMGVTSLALAQALSVAETALIRVLGPYVESGALAYRSGYYATPDFAPRLTPEQQTFFDRALAGEPSAPSAPIPADALHALLKTNGIPELARAFDTLVATGVLVKVGAFVYRGAQISAIRSRLESALRGGGQITVGEFRDLTGTSRKYAIPLLEFFDATGVTLRSGDTRVLRRTTLSKRA